MLKRGFVPLRANLGQQVYQYLIDKIYKMEIEPGTQLGIGEMSDQLGVSRSPVRDAFLRLLAEGVLELLPSGSYRVIEFTRKYIDDVFVVRHALELTAVRLSVQNLDHARIQRLRDTWAEFLDFNGSDPTQLERHGNADQELHQTIAEMSGNLLLKDALDKIIAIAHLIRRWHYAGQIPHEQLILTAEEHLRVLDAMLERDSGAAVAALDAHLSTAHARTIERLDSGAYSISQND
jgi:GntR family transcriptional regulator, rspAB operon transcriptional repressor